MASRRRNSRIRMALRHFAQCPGAVIPAWLRVFQNDSLTFWSVVAPQQFVVTVRRTVDLMQAPGRAAKSAAGTTVKMLVVQDDRLEVVGVVGEFMQSPRRTALAFNRVANFWR
jgi:hypothetical protein